MSEHCGCSGSANAERGGGGWKPGRYWLSGTDQGRGRAGTYLMRLWSEVREMQDKLRLKQDRIASERPVHKVGTR